MSLTTEGIDEILATRSQAFKELNLDIEELTVSEVLELLIQKPKLLRRPIIVNGDKLVVGYNPGELLKLKNTPYTVLFPEKTKIADTLHVQYIFVFSPV